MGNMGSVIPDLAAIRQRRGLSLREIAVTTKIQMFYLEAIERGHFEKLPGGVYSKSFVRQYAKAIDFDEGTLLHALPPEQEEEQTPAPGWRQALLRRLFRLEGASLEGGEPAASRTG
jgi:cytoskeletal protein RodZ